MVTFESKSYCLRKFNLHWWLGPRGCLEKSEALFFRIFEFFNTNSKFQKTRCKNEFIMIRPHLCRFGVLTIYPITTALNKRVFIRKRGRRIQSVDRKNCAAAEIT